MTEKEKKSKSGEISRREFLKDAGLLVGGTAIGSTVLLAACGGDGGTETVTKTVTSTVPGGTVTTTMGEVTKTVTTTVPGGTGVQTVTVTKTVEVPGAAAENVISLTVNGYNYNITVEPNLNLYELLHKLGWTSVKKFCDRGACGACTAIVDGRPILSCMTLAITCDGKTIETAEGIAASGHPLIEAYVKYHCMQCGYCTPGFLVTAKALLDRNPEPTREQAIDAIAGNLCRCGTYIQHPLAILEAAGQL